jgi:uncharacterized protein YuzE
MKIEYSKNIDALYIRLREAEIGDSIDIEEGVTVDLDEKGHIVGVEILDASFTDKHGYYSLFIKKTGIRFLETGIRLREQVSVNRAKGMINRQSFCLAVSTHEIRAKILQKSSQTYLKF